VCGYPIEPNDLGFLGVGKDDYINRF